MSTEVQTIYKPITKHFLCTPHGKLNSLPMLARLLVRITPPSPPLKKFVQYHFFFFSFYVKINIPVGDYLQPVP